MLKDQTDPEDPRLDRLIEFDDRSREFPLQLDHRKLRSYTWRCNPRYDQGQEGACVGFGIGHELAARPSEVQGLSNQYLRTSIYWEAQKIDQWPGGEYPGASPRYGGTSVLAGVKIAQKLGYFESYRWTFNLNDLILGVGYHGPAVLGLAWYESMFSPDPYGYIYVSGQVAGGHSICCRGVDVINKRFLLRNSWGINWGMSGDCYLRFEDMERLLAERGEAVFFLNRKVAPGQT